MNTLRWDELDKDAKTTALQEFCTKGLLYREQEGALIKAIPENLSNPYTVGSIIETIKYLEMDFYPSGKLYCRFC